MKLSVIIPCLNEAEYIGAQLEALANQRWSEPWEVIIADNGSTDGSLAAVSEYKDRFASLRVVDASDRRGQAHAKNVGAMLARGEALAFCDADDEVAPGWVSAIGRALGEYDFVASRFDIEKLNAPWVRESHGNPQQHGLNIYRYPPYLPHSGGSGLGIKRALHEAVGGFDESWRLLEDTDYCFRVQLAGGPLHFVPDAVVHVRYRHSLGDLWHQARSWGEFNVRIYKTYRPLGMPKLSWKSGVLAWMNLLRQIPQIRSQVGRTAWLWRSAWLLGRLQGSIKYRVLAL